MTTARREEILEAALKVFAERGFRGASFDVVAERAGLTRQGVLHYFPSKKKLLAGVLRFREEVHREHLAGAYTEEDLPSLLAEVVVFDHSMPALAQTYTRLLAEGAVQDDPVWTDVQDYNLALQEYVEERLGARYGERLPSGLSLRAAAMALLALLAGLQERWMFDQREADYPEIMREVFSILLGSAPV
jgi:AcrR family transcriptional regulator